MSSIAEFINYIASPLKSFFYGDYWFITLPIFLSPFIVYLVFEIRHTVMIIRKRRKKR